MREILTGPATRASETVQAWLRVEGRNQEGLAALVSKRVGREVRQSTISAIARGVSQPRADILAALEAELGIELSWWATPASTAASNDDGASPDLTGTDAGG